MRRYTFIILFALLAVMIAACTDDTPSDTRGCIAEEGQAADEIYNRDDGCLHGDIIHAAEGEVEDTAEGDEHEEEESAEDEESESEDVEDAEAESEDEVEE